MEQNEEGVENTNPEVIEEDSMTVTSNAIFYLKETANWAQFLSILGFILIGFMVIGSIFAGTIFSQFDEFAALPFPGFLIGAMYLIFAIFYFFPVYYLYKFSSHIKNSIVIKDSIALEAGLKNLKSHYKFLGVTTIVVIALYILLIIVGIFVGSMFDL